MSTLNTTGTSKDFLESVAREIEEATKSFWNDMTKEEREVIKSLPRIAQRVTFFDSFTLGSNYKYYREALREWLLFGKLCKEWNLSEWNKKLNLIEEGAVERVEGLFAADTEFGYMCWCRNLMKDINDTREKLLAENPILMNENIDIYDRRRMMNLALKADKWYVECEKDFTRMINKVISTLITRYLYQ